MSICYKNPHDIVRKYGQLIANFIQTVKVEEISQYDQDFTVGIKVAIPEEFASIIVEAKRRNRPLKIEDLDVLNGGTTPAIRVNII